VRALLADASAWEWVSYDAPSSAVPVVYSVTPRTPPKTTNGAHGAVLFQ